MAEFSSIQITSKEKTWSTKPEIQNSWSIHLSQLHRHLPPHQPLLPTYTMVLGLRSEILESPTGPPPFASGAFLFVFGVSAEGAQAQLVKTEEVQGLQVLYYI